MTPRIVRTVRHGIVSLESPRGRAQRLRRGLWTVAPRRFEAYLVRSERAARAALR